MQMVTHNTLLSTGHFIHHPHPISQHSDSKQETGIKENHPCSSPQLGHQVLSWSLTPSPACSPPHPLPVQSPHWLVSQAPDEKLQAKLFSASSKQ